MPPYQQCFAPIILPHVGHVSPRIPRQLVCGNRGHHFPFHDFFHPFHDFLFFLFIPLRSFNSSKFSSSTLKYFLSSSIYFNIYIHHPLLLSKSNFIVCNIYLFQFDVSVNCHSTDCRDDAHTRYLRIKSNSNSTEKKEPVSFYS